MEGVLGKGRPGLIERGLLDWLEQPGPLLERRGRAKRQKRPSSGKHARESPSLGIWKVCSFRRTTGLGVGEISGSFTLGQSVAERRLRNVCL